MEAIAIRPASVVSSSAGFGRARRRQSSFFVLLADAASRARMYPRFPLGESEVNAP